jgi:hypothetical protein
LLVLLLLAALYAASNAHRSTIAPTGRIASSTVTSRSQTDGLCCIANY